MADEVAKPDWKWDDFYEAEREAATVGDKVVGVPALVDNLAIVYNKKLFADAGVAPPTPDWTWDDFRAAAAKLTDPAKGQYGWLIPADGSEDTVWHYIPMLWEAGGDILNPDNTKAAFNSDAGVKALTTLQQMAVTDKSLYLDTTNENGPKLMNSGKVAMLVTGPWDLSQLSDIDYGVQVMPTFAGSSGGHQTIAGPDNWVVFDNGDKRKQAAIDFVKWLSAPEQVKTFSLGTGDLPIRTSVGQDQAVLDKLNENVPGTAAFVENLSNVKKVRPQVEQYPAISEALGQAIVSVMLGKDQPPGGAERRRPGRRRGAGREVGESTARTARRRLSRTRHRAGWALVSPAVVLIGIFGLLPVLMSLQLSFQKSDLLTPRRRGSASTTTRSWPKTRSSSRRSSTPSSTPRCSFRARCWSVCSSRRR